MEEGNQAVIGQAQTTTGRVLLSKPDLIAGFQNPVDRKNVGMHEFAHMIDAGDGSVDGTFNEATLGGHVEGHRLEAQTAQTVVRGTKTKTAT